jgi:hypothetical protein
MHCQGKHSGAQAGALQRRPLFPAWSPPVETGTALSYLREA